MANTIRLVGEITSDVEKLYSIYSGEDVYGFELSSARNSGVSDIVKCQIPSGIMPDDLRQYDRVYLFGEIRTRNTYDDSLGRNRLDVYVWVREFDFAKDDEEDTNEVDIEGFICKEPVFRCTPLGRNICDLLIASNRGYGKTAYIPSIAWGRLANVVSLLDVGTKVCAKGRFQSRFYNKKISDTEVEERVAYELSIDRIEVVENEED